MGTKEQRLEVIRAALGIKQAPMAELMGIDQPYYSHIIKGTGRGNLRLEHVENLTANAGVNPIWLLTGQGAMFLTDRKGPLATTDESVEILYGMVIEAEGIDEKSIKTSLKHLIKLICAYVITEYPDASSYSALAFAVRTVFRIYKRTPQIDIIKALGLELEASKILGEDHK